MGMLQTLNENMQPLNENLYLLDAIVLHKKSIWDRIFMFINVGSTQVPFLACTLEIPQKLQQKFLLLTFVIWLLWSFSLNYDLIFYFCFCSLFQSYGSFNHTNSTSLSFSEFSELFTSIVLVAQHIESHFALSSARCHF